MRAVVRCLFLTTLSTCSCQSGDDGPRLNHIAPAVVFRAGLPAPATLVGVNLRPLAGVSLDDTEQVQIASPVVYLNDVHAPVLDHSDPSEVRILLPAELPTGTYDVRVESGPSVAVTLPSGLRVVSSPFGLPNGTNDALRDDSAGTTSGEVSTSGDTSAPGGTSTDGEGFRCGAGDFGLPQLVSVQGHSGTRIWSPTFSQDGFTLYFTEAGPNEEILMRAVRTERTGAFFGATPVPAPFTSGGVGTPYLSATGLSLYFYSVQTMGVGNRDLFVAERRNNLESFTSARQLTELNSADLDHLPWVSPDELTIVFVSRRNGASAYWTATRPSRDAPFSTPVVLESLSDTFNGRLFISNNGLRAYFTGRDREGGVGADDVWYATRTTLDADFTDVTNLRAVNTPGSETEVTVTADGEELYFVRMGLTANTLYRAIATCD